MSVEDQYLDINRHAWNKRTAVHINSDFYNNPAFIDGKQSLPDIDLDYLGDITQKSVLHLQCHFGQDSISMSRLGARVCGIDLSDKAIEEARILAERCHADTRFICCDLYSLPQQLHEQYDIVYTSYGTIGWLPDIKKWARVISHFLKPGGRLVFVEFHPVLWMYDNDFNDVTYPYFNSAPIIETEAGTYADNKADINAEMVTWNHGLAEVMTALMQEQMRIVRFEEFNYSPYNCFSNMQETSPGKFTLKNFGDKVPMVYAIEAMKQ